VVSHPRLDEVWLISLDPTHGSEIRKTRPCLVVSPDEINRHLRTVIIAPMTTSERPYPTRVTIDVPKQAGTGGPGPDPHGRPATPGQEARLNIGEDCAGAQAVSTVLVEMFTRS
jgi:mRNA interferase MazF